MKYARYLKSFHKLSINDKLIFSSCYLLSAISAFIVLLPLKYYYRIFTLNPSSKEGKIEVPSLFFLMKKVRKVAFWNFTCLNQVITLKIISYILGIRSTVKFTILDYNNETAKAHASLIFDNQIEYLPLNERKSYIELCIN